MKDLLKRLLCIVLALTMVVCLVACGSSEDEEEEEEEETTEEDGKKGGKKDKETTAETTEEPEEEVSPLVGEWEATVDLSDYVSDGLYAQGMEIDVEDFAIVMTYTFDEDGTYEAELDTSMLEDSIDGIMDQLWELLIEISAEQAGVSLEEMEAALVAEGYTKDVLKAELGLEESVAETFEEIAESGEWVLEDDELFMHKKNPEKADPVTIEFDGDDEFSIVDGPFLGDDVDEEMLEYILPIVFERV